MVNFRHSSLNGETDSQPISSVPGIDPGILNGVALDAWTIKPNPASSEAKPQLILVNEYSRMPQPLVPNVAPGAQASPSEITQPAEVMTASPPQNMILGAPTIPNSFTPVRNKIDTSTPNNPQDWINISPSAALQELGSQPNTYDSHATYGSDPHSHLFDDATKISGFVLGSAAIMHRKKVGAFQWLEPNFVTEPLIKEGYRHAVNTAAREAHGFLIAEVENLQATETGKLTPDALQSLNKRLGYLNAAMQKTNPARINGHAYLDPIFSSSEPLRHPDYADVWEHLEPLDKAQNDLISAREIAVEELKMKELTSYNAKVRTRKVGQLGDFGALIGADAINYEIDQLSPTVTVSKATIWGDLAMPIVVGLEMNPLFRKFGKFAPIAEPLIKGVAMVGVHAFTHFTFDSNEKTDQ